MPKVVSLFSGCGGSDAGALVAGFEVVMANDVLPYARDVYLANNPATEYCLGDVAGITRFPAAELLIGCYPCQGFSQGGLRDPARRINLLYLEFARALRAIQPKAFIVENVSGMMRKDFSHLLADQIKAFGEAGYRVEKKVLNAQDYGVAQERKRIFIVGLRKDLGLDYVFPEPTHGKDKTACRTIRDVIGDLPEWPEGEFYDDGFHWYYLSRNRRRDWNQPAKTIVANPRHMPLHPISPELEKIDVDAWRFVSDAPARRFSYREAARLQGFPRDFVFPDSENGSLAMRYKVAGNAVPPPLFEAVARALPDVWEA
jgi:DNA (cytosine-5)-methyltransferase 1